MLTNILIAIGFILLIPIVSDIVLPESHICQSVLKRWPLYNKVEEHVEAHSTAYGWLVFALCVFIMIPLLFRWGYLYYKPKEPNILGYYPPIYEHTDSRKISYDLVLQINANDSLFIARLASDSIVFNRKTNKLVYVGQLETPPAGIDRYSGCSRPTKFLLGMMVIPKWQEVKENLNFSSNGKKAWIICLIAAGYFGFNQGAKCRKTELAKESWDDWMLVQHNLASESFWVKFAREHPYRN